MPQPVDLQTEVAKVSAAERVQQMTDRASLLAQQRTASQAQTDRLSVEQQVQETPETEQQPVQADGRRKNPFLGRRRHRRDEPGETGADADSPDDSSGGSPDDDAHHLDVTV